VKADSVGNRKEERCRELEEGEPCPSFRADVLAGRIVSRLGRGSAEAWTNAPALHKKTAAVDKGRWRKQKSQQANIRETLF
jgi:hypothetical protein